MSKQVKKSTKSKAKEPTVPLTPIQAGGRMLRMHLDASTTKYAEALFDAEFAAVNSMPVKQPSLVDLPTKTINLKNTFTASPNQDGKLLLSWRPNYLDTPMNQSWLSKNYISQKLIGQTLPTGTPDDFIITEVTNIERDYCKYSQLTVNDSGTLDGESANNSNVFVPFKEIEIPATKYRLVSAKMVITYNGKADDESGTIISGLHTGFLQPASCSHFKGNGKGTVAGVTKLWQAPQLPAESALTMQDQSDEMAQFGQFDNIQNLYRGKREPVVKKKKYEFNFFPTDFAATIFTNVGSLGITEAKPEFKLSPRAYSTDMTMDNVIDYPFQDEQRFQAMSTGHSVNASTTPTATNPTFIVAFQNLTNQALNDIIEINIYENYEVFTTAGITMLARAPSAKLDPEFVRRVNSERMNGSKKRSFAEWVNMARDVWGIAHPILQAFGYL